MRFITFRKQNGQTAAGWIFDGRFAVDMHEASKRELPKTMLEFLADSAVNQKKAKSLQLHPDSPGVYPLESVRLLAPLPNPLSFRDFYAFEQHVKTARKNRGLDMVPEWYEMPVFYFSNHLAFRGPGEEIERPPGCTKLDYELEIACVIGKKGKDIIAEKAEKHIFGYCILNDWSARDFQQKEMKVGLGPAKGKDFATSIGPWVLTADELVGLQTGKGYDLKMSASVNGKLISEGNFKDIHFSFAEMIERASTGTTLYPGEMIGSGTVGTGCILELGEEVHRWLRPGDLVELKIENLGVLKNKIVGEKG
ncbi:fumarylacetoacetate hydrolase family protein [Neobacillus notoginsengisoli]|uniref:Fumarylacetoacetate hydrolase family protein n=1 Tax=Neobacillus notoginsengisoli TaxID=1578198 RepID=A0A417YX24_9BACI|nr:fumarylacetoacetate hydrolase family protein [Neobacillus notoginsengisoli]RHW42111.1 fumarylacetoacetate hydrolase family protein [Neobacillus notoginsengisoli]